MWPLACRQAPAAGLDDQTAIKFKRCRQPPEDTTDESGSLNKKLIKQTAARRQVQPNPTTMQPQATTPSTSPIVLMCRRLPSLLPRPTDWSWLLARSNQSWSMRLFFFKWAHVLVIWVQPYFSQPIRMGNGYQISELFDICIRLNINMDIRIRIWIKCGSKVDPSESDFHWFSLSDSTSVFNNIRHYLYPFHWKTI